MKGDLCVFAQSGFGSERVEVRMERLRESNSLQKVLRGLTSSEGDGGGLCCTRVSLGRKDGLQLALKNVR